MIESWVPIQAGSIANQRLRQQPETLPQGLWPYAPTLDGVMKAANTLKPSMTDREALVSALVAHQRSIGHEAGIEIAQKLLDPRSLVIVTGQQPSLFGGALMVFAKIMHTYKVAAELEQELGRPVIPLYWNHSEDHDLEEVNRYERFKNASVIKDSAPIQDLGQSLDQIEITPEVRSYAEDCLADAGLRGIDHEELLPRIGEPFPTWNSRVVHAIMPQYPVLHAEPKVLRPFLGEFFAKAFTDAQTLFDLHEQSHIVMRENGLKPQVRPADPSFVFHIDDEKKRTRLHLREGQWTHHGSHRLTLTTAALAQAAREHPEQFSCNVLLRPIAQQTLLPIVAQVNGPAEVAYFGGLPKLYEHFGVQVPAVLPRITVTFLRKKDLYHAAELNIQTADLLSDSETWPLPETEDTSEIDAVFSKARQALSAIEGDLQTVAKNDGLVRALEGFSKRIEDATAKFQQTVVKDAGRATQVLKQKRHRLSEWIRPRGRPQERVMGPLALSRGRHPSEMVDLIAQVDPWDYRHHILLQKEEA